MELKILPKNAESLAALLMLVIAAGTMTLLIGESMDLASPERASDFEAEIVSNQPEYIPNITLDCDSSDYVIKGQNAFRCTYNTSKIQNETLLHILNKQVVELRWYRQEDLGSFQGVYDHEIHTGDLPGGGEFILTAPWESGNLSIDIYAEDDCQDSLQNHTGEEDMFLNLRTDFQKKWYRVYSSSSAIEQNSFSLLTAGFNLFVLFSIMIGGFSLILNLNEKSVRESTRKRMEKIGVLLLLALVLSLVWNLWTVIRYILVT